jgi:glycosyltransferase involved in cell wall biosynthesis
LPPIDAPQLFKNLGQLSYAFVPGRINQAKRQDLAIRALAKCPKGLNLLIAGPPEDENYITELFSLRKQYGLEERVRFDFRFLPREEYASYMNQSSAVIYCPFQEDSSGYVALEAALAHKPVVTCSDSGGVRDFVFESGGGYVSAPNPSDLALTMEKLVNDPEELHEMGTKLHGAVAKMNLSWTNVLEGLTR